MKLPTLLMCAFMAACGATTSFHAAAEWIERPDWGETFRRFGAKGTFVTYELERDRFQIYDRKRADQRFLPASTFKIPNALIALDLGVVKDENELFKWDRKPRLRKEWEKDLTLQEALRVSAVPVFQDIARRVGNERMQKGVQRLGYGNQDIRGGIDQFWLSGNLRISAMEQIAFLRKLHGGLLGVSPVAQDVVKRMLIVDNAPTHVLRAKTGTVIRATKPVGWWVGWVERRTDTGTRTVFFAMNMDWSAKTKFEDRMAIAKTILSQDGALP